MHKDNSKKLWQLLKEATKTQADNTSVEPEILNQTTANKFNNFFATIGRKTLEKLNISEPSFTPTLNHGLTFDPTTPSEIEKLIDGMKLNSAVGHDKVPAKILKRSKTYPM